ncbi:MAG: NfeD family protein [Clostridia bacterium]|nr:NfeD family protein [Clostridia bacterium]
MESMVIFWAAVMALALFGEIITAELVAVWFIPSSLVSMILAFFNVSIWIQWLVFLALSAVLLVVAFKFLRKLLLKNIGNKKTDTDILIGKLARVEEDIDNAEMQGAVKIDGKIWSARMVDDSESAQKGEFVIVEYISGVKLICRRQK